MTCPHCGHEPPAGSTFCNGCGAKLAIICASCGAAPPPGSRFCNACGATLGASPSAPGPVVRSSPDPRPAAPRALSDARKVVTILFADLAGSTALHERLDPESVRRFMESYYQAMRAAIEAHGGTLVKVLGDGVMAAFGVPHVAEDDAIRAVHAGVDMQEAFRTLARAHAAIGLRVAINTGEVVVSADNADVVGDPVNVAARLQQEARDGDVVLGESTRRLVAARVTLEPLGSFALKGRTERVKAYRVGSLDRPTGAAAVPFVGRDEELARIGTLYDAAVTRPATRLAVLLGSPGLGKSRLIDEVGRRLGDNATVISAQCDAAGGATFAPVAKALRELVYGDERQSDRSDRPDDARAAVETLIPTDDTDRARIAGGMAALLAGSPPSPEETFFVIRRFLTGLASDKPVVLVIDDLHWAEPLLLDLVEHLVQWGSGVRLLVLVGARPELRERRSSLVTPGGVVADVVTLSGLDAGAAMQLAANVIGAADLPAAVAAKVLATSEGNPLFVGELVRMLVDERAIERQGDRWIVGTNLAALEMPPTIHALLAARIERLHPEERTVLEHASVVGRHFSRSAVAALLSRNGSELDARLEALRRGELIEPDAGWFLGEPALRFHHVLIRDAAYRRLLKGTRAELHERLADWIGAKVGDITEHDGTIGWHLEQAHQHLRELGALDAKARSLGERAAHRLAAAGRRALARDDLPVAADLLGRAIDRLDADDPSRADLALDWCEALLAAGDVGRAACAIDELGHFVSGPPTNNPTTNHPTPHNRSSRLSAWHTCFTGQLTALTAPQELQTAADAVSAAAEGLATLGDAAGEAKAHSVRAQALARLGRVGACEAALDQALAAARKAGDRRRVNAVLAGAPLAALWGPSPVTRASGRCLDVVRVLRITQGAPAVEAVALSCQGVLEALRGRIDAARRMIASARGMVEELGIAHRLFEADVFAGRIDLLEGDAAAAERTLRGAYDGLRDLGLGIDAARAGALLGRAQLVQGQVTEAEALSRESEALAGDDLQAAIAWRGVRAEALAHRGETAAAVELAQAAVTIAAATDALLDHADARLALATALRAAGRTSEADAEEQHAVELWKAKGATLLAERAPHAAPHFATWEGEAPAEPLLPVNGSTGASPSQTTSGRVRANAAPAVSSRAPTPAQPRRRVRANAATASLARFDAVITARDVDALAPLLSEPFALVHHPTATSYGRRGMLATWRSLLRAEHLAYRHEVLATLGGSLELHRHLIRAEGFAEEHLRPAGSIELEEICVMEVDEQGVFRHCEIFAPDHLGDAIARLYERSAEPLPEGPERERVAATARSVTVGNGVIDPERLATAFAASIECVDHRALHTWTSRGADEFLGHWREQIDLAAGFAGRHDDILALAPDAFLVRQTYAGRVRATGGTFENVILALFAFGRDGLITRIEIWELGCEADALARFDALAGDDAARRPPPRRVRLNTASRTSSAIAAAFTRRDLGAVDALLADPLQTIEHPTGTTYGRNGQLESSRRMMRVPDLAIRLEPLATLGESLCLTRRVVTASGTGGSRLDVGEYELESIILMEVDAAGRLCFSEVFAADHLGDAIVRLYERLAELLPPGPACARAAGVARALAVWNGPVDVDAVGAAYDPSSRSTDHRVFGTWSARNAGEMLRDLRLQLDLAPDFAARYDDVVASAADALVARVTFFGTARDSAGRFENRLCVLFRFGADGRGTSTDVYEAEQVAEALAHFDDLRESDSPSEPLWEGGRPGEPQTKITTSAPARRSAGRRRSKTRER